MASAFDTKVHHVDPVTMKIVKVTPHRRFVRGDTVMYEQPPHSGKYFCEDGSQASTDQLIALGFIKAPEKGAEPLQATISQIMKVKPVEAEKPAKKKPGRKPGFKAKPAAVVAEAQNPTPIEDVRTV